MNGVDCSACASYSCVGEALMRRQFVLDKDTNKLLDELASYRAGNRSLVIREAIRIYADMEDRLDEIEAEPGFQKMMSASDRAVREGRVTSHEKVKRMAAARNKKRR
jgi:predicted transcriptional regulator